MPKQDPFNLKSEESPGDFFKSWTGNRKIEDFAKMSANLEKTKKHVQNQTKRVEQASHYMSREYKQFASSFKTQLSELMGAISEVDQATSVLEDISRNLDYMANESENSARALKEESAAVHNIYGTWAKAIAKHEKSGNMKDKVAVEIAFKAYGKAKTNSLKRLGEGYFFTKQSQERYKKLANVETTAFFASAARILKALSEFKKSLVENEQMLRKERVTLKSEESKLARLI